MKPQSIVGALAGGVVGAFVWGMMLRSFDFELGYFALGVGALVGLGAYLMGSRGAIGGSMCVFVAMLALFGGKAIGTTLLMSATYDKTAVNTMVEQALDETYYMESMKTAEAFSKVRNESQYRKFIVDMGVIPVQDASEVSDADVEYFKYRMAPELRSWAKNPPSYDAWRAQREPSMRKEAEAAMKARQADTSFTELMSASVNHIDIIFGISGLVAAFAIGYGMKATR